MRVYRGQVLGPADIDAFLKRSDGLPVDAVSISVEVWDYTGVTPVQVYGPVNPGHPGVGQYYLNWTIPLLANIGTHRAVWTWQMLSSTPIRTASEEFEVYDSSIITPTSLWITPAEVYAEGFPQSQYPLSLINSRLAFVQSYVERMTGFIFAPTPLVLDLDGSGTPLLRIPQPIISISKIEVLLNSAGQYETQNLSNFAIYNRFYPDDRWNPKILVKSTDSFNIYQAFATSGTFPQGTQNIRVTGVFGFTDPPNNTIPEPVRIAMMLLLKLLLYPAYSPQLAAALKSAGVNWQTTDGHQYRLSEAMVKGSLTGFSYIDTILSYYAQGSGVTVSSIG